MNQGQFEIKIHNKLLNLAEGQRLLQAIDEKLTGEPNYQDLIDIATGLPPVVPYCAHAGNNQQNFELSTLLQHLLVQQKYYHPITMQRLVPNDLGRQMVANHELIQKIDALLLAENSSREELLACFNISEDLYRFLLEYQHDPQLGVSESVCRKTLKNYGSKLLIFLLFCPLFAVPINIYRVSASDPELAKKLNQFILESFEKITRSDLGLYYKNPLNNTHIPVQSQTIIESSICNTIGTVWPIFSPFNEAMMRCSNNFEINTTSFNARNNNCTAYPEMVFGETLPHISFKDKPDLDFFHLCGGAVLTYTSVKIYDHFRLGRPWQRLLDDQNFRAALLLNVGIIIIGIDGYYDCFGLVSLIQDKSGAAADVCKSLVVACNKGYEKTNVVAGEALTFRLPDNLPVSTTAIPSRKAAAILNMITPGIAALIAGGIGFFANENQDRHEVGKREFVALKERQYQYLLPPPSAPKRNRCSPCVIL